LVIVDSSIDIICLKKGYCKKGAEAKLDTKIIHTVSQIEGNDFMSLKNKYGIKGVAIKCECF
jgi:hypothetical protein